jgi:hypothetical protein
MDSENKESTEKTRGELLREKLFYEGTNLAKELDDSEIAQSDNYCEDYKAFMAASKTEREAVEEICRMAEERGFRTVRQKGKIRDRRKDIQDKSRQGDNSRRRGLEASRRGSPYNRRAYRFAAPRS